MRCEMVATMLEEASDNNECRQSGNEVVDTLVVEQRQHSMVQKDREMRREQRRS